MNDDECDDFVIVDSTPCHPTPPRRLTDEERYKALKRPQDFFCDEDCGESFFCDLRHDLVAGLDEASGWCQHCDAELPEASDGSEETQSRATG